MMEVNSMVRLSWLLVLGVIFTFVFTNFLPSPTVAAEPKSARKVGRIYSAAGDSIHTVELDLWELYGEEAESAYKQSHPDWRNDPFDPPSALNTDTSKIILPVADTVHVMIIRYADGNPVNVPLTFSEFNDFLAQERVAHRWYKWNISLKDSTITGISQQYEP
jgi:hypothetical protein